MKITVTRKTGLFGFATSLKLRVNNHVVAKISNNETLNIQIDVPAGEPAMLSAGILNKTTLPIQDGDELLIENNPFYIYCFIALIACLFIRVFNRIFTLLILPICAGAFLLKQFKITKTN